MSNPAAAVHAAASELPKCDARSAGSVLVKIAKWSDGRLWFWCLAAALPLADGGLRRVGSRAAVDKTTSQSDSALVRGRGGGASESRWDREVGEVGEVGEG